MEGILWYRKLMNELKVKVLDTCVINVYDYTKKRAWVNGSDGEDGKGK